MATTPKTLFRGFSTTNVGTVLYTVPASTNTVVTSIIITNASDVSKTVTIYLQGGYPIVSLLPITARQTIILDNVRQQLGATETITGGSDVANVIFHIGGVEVVA